MMTQLLKWHIVTLIVGKGCQRSLLAPLGYLENLITARQCRLKESRPSQLVLLLPFDQRFYKGPDF